MKVLLALCVAWVLSSASMAQAPDLSGKDAFVPIWNPNPHEEICMTMLGQMVPCLPRLPLTGTGPKQNTPSYQPVTILRGSR